MRRVLMYAIPIVMAVGLLAAVANSPEDGTKLAADIEQPGKVTETTIPAVIESPPVTVPITSPPAVEETTTTTTTSPPAPTPPTMAKPKPAASSRPATPPTTQAPAPTPVEEPPAIDCGTGSASARSRLVNDGGVYKLTATVLNESTKEIQLDSLVVTATYSDGTKNYEVNVGGRIVEARPGAAEMTFEIPESAGSAPSTFQISEFRFHTAGFPQCTSQ